MMDKSMSFRIERFILEFVAGAILGALGGIAICYKITHYSGKGLTTFIWVGALIGGFLFALSKSPVKTLKDK
jgi:uncharacterized protein YcfJ